MIETCWRCHTIRDKILEGIHTSGSHKSKTVRDLNRSWLGRKDLQSASRSPTIEINQNVNLVLLANHFGNASVRHVEFREIHVVDGIHDGCCDGVIDVLGGEAEDFILLLVVRHHETKYVAPDRMALEIGRDVPNSEFA